jgi:hypothetical protein
MPFRIYRVYDRFQAMKAARQILLLNSTSCEGSWFIDAEELGRVAAFDVDSKWGIVLSMSVLKQVENSNHYAWNAKISIA